MRKSVRSTLKSNSKFEVKGSIWIACNGERFFGPGPLELLERIQETGSINQAAKQMKMSYKKASDLVNRLNAGAATPMVVGSPGGKDGGGSVLADAALDLIQAYRTMREKFAQFLETESSIFNK